MKLIDFDALYNDYVVKWSGKNSQRLKDTDPMQFVDEIYEGWINTPYKQLDNLTPLKYFTQLSGKEAANMLVEYTRQNIGVPSLLTDILAHKSNEGYLLDILTGCKDQALFITAANILQETESQKHIDIMADILLDGNADIQLREFAAEILLPHKDIVKYRLVNNIAYDLGATDRLIADVLVYCKGIDKVYSLLEKLFLSGKDNALYASYLGMYEDGRALEMLNKRIAQSDTGYVEFLELRNAIERLGGEVNTERDFSSDPDYKALKNIK